MLCAKNRFSSYEIISGFQGFLSWHRYLCSSQAYQLLLKINNNIAQIRTHTHAHMYTNQINWFRNRKAKKRGETETESSRTRNRNRSQSRHSPSIQFNQTSSIYEYKIFTRNTRIIQSMDCISLSLALFLISSHFPSLLAVKKEIKCGRHVATLLLIWHSIQTGADADADVDVVWLKWSTFVCDCVCVCVSGVQRKQERDRMIERQKGMGL